MSDPPDDEAPRKRKSRIRSPPNIAQSSKFDDRRVQQAAAPAEINGLMQQRLEAEVAETPAQEPFAFEQHRDEPESIEPLDTEPAIPRLSADTEHGDDCLGVEQEAQAFARIICSRQTGTPLSVGLFGDWGSGKSFFIGLMQREIEARGKAFERVAQRLEGEQSPAEHAALGERWHGRIAQITFNAWHYAEPNLWASLVTRVFDELAGVLNPEESVEDTRARLLAEVSEGKQRREQARVELRKAEQQLAEARAERERREAQLVELRDELAVVEVVAPADDAAPTGKPEEQAPPPLKVDGALAALRVTLRWVWSRGRGTRALLVISGLLLLGSLLLLLAWWREWMVVSPAIAVTTSALGAAAGLVSTLSAWVKLIRPRLQAAIKAHEAATKGKLVFDGFIHRAVQDLLRPGEGPATLARRRFETARVELESATAATDQASAQLAQTRRLLQQLQGGRRFYDFINDRGESQDYRQHLGLVSLIREDFERLEKILSQVEREGPGEPRAQAPISRIVLYIDDLDRCEPERVVEVLQAVHLLLATPIFVVVVAVDVRWLRRSLTLHYDRLLQTPREGQPGHEDEARPTPKNYLEKIFQIPFSLRPMGASGFSSLVQSLVRADIEASGPPASTGPEHEPSEPPRVSPQPQRQHEQEITSDVVVSLDPAEIAFMQRLHAVIDTPRLAKALVNTYRLLRAELPPAELPAYLEQQQYREVLILLAIQVGRSREASILFDELENEDAPTLSAVVARLAESRRPRDRWLDLQAALEEIIPSGQFAHRFEPWIERVRRFSFNPWPTG